MALKEIGGGPKKPNGNDNSAPKKEVAKPKPKGKSKGKKTNEETAFELLTLRDRKIFLERKLKSINEKHGAAKEWILDNERSIVEGYQKLISAIKQAESAGDIRIISNTLHGLGAVKGLILDIPMPNGARIIPSVIDSIGDTPSFDQKSLIKTLNDIPLGVPPSALKSIDDAAEQDIEEAKKANAAELDEKSPWWKRVTGGEQKELQRELAAVKSDMLSIEMDPMHGKAMVKGFFDYMRAATITDYAKQADLDEAPNHENLQDQYQDVQYIINIAQHDFNETLTAFTDQIVGISVSYNKLCDYMDALSSDTPQDIKNLIAIMSECPDFAKISSWYAEEQDKQNFISAIQDKTKSTTPAFFEHLNLLNQMADLDYVQSAHSAVNLFQSMMVTYLETDDIEARQSVLSTTLDTLARSKVDIALKPILIGTDALKKIYESDLPYEERLGLVTQLSTIANPDVTTSSLKWAFEALDAIKQNDYKTVQKLISDVNTAYIPEVYAMMRLLEPDVDLVDFSLNGPSTAETAKLFMTTLKNTYTGLLSQDIKGAVAHALEDTTWSNNLTKLYGYMDKNGLQTYAVAIKAALEQSTEKGRPIDVAIAAQDETLLSNMLSFLPTPIMRAQYLREQIDAAPTKELQKAYKDLADVLDHTYLEYDNGQFINPDKILNAYYSKDNSGAHTIFYIAEGRIIKSPRPISEEEGTDILRNLLNRDGFIHIGKEVLQPRKVGYAHLQRSANTNQLYVRADGRTVEIEVYAEEVDSILSELQEHNPNLIQLGDHAIDASVADYIFFEDDVLNIIHDNVCILSASCKAEDKDDILAAFENTGNFENINGHLINLDTVATTAYFPEQQKLTFAAGKSLFFEGAKIPMMNRSSGVIEIPVIECDNASAENLIKSLKKKGAIVAGTKTVNPDDVLCIEQSSEGLKIMFSDGQDMLYDHASPDEQESLFNSITSLPDFIGLDGVHINTSKIQNIWVTQGSRNTQAFMAGHQIELPMISKKDMDSIAKRTNLISTGRELFDPSAVSSWTPNVKDQKAETSFGNKTTSLWSANVEALTDSLVEKAMVTKAKSKKAKYAFAKKLRKTAANTNVADINHSTWIDRLAITLSEPGTILFGDNDRVSNFAVGTQNSATSPVNDNVLKEALENKDYSLVNSILNANNLTIKKGFNDASKIIKSQNSFINKKKKGFKF